MKRKVTISLDAALLERIDGLAKAMGMKRSTFIQRYMFDAMEERRRVEIVLNNPKLVERLGDPRLVGLFQDTLKYATMDERRMLALVVNSMMEKGHGTKRHK